MEGTYWLSAPLQEVISAEGQFFHSDKIINAMRGMIAEEDLLQDPKREAFPSKSHLTLFMNIPRARRPVSLVSRLVDRQLQMPTLVNAMTLDCFTFPTHDVLFIRVIRTRAIMKLRLQLEERFPDAKQEREDWIPHITLAYLKPECGSKYRGLPCEFATILKEIHVNVLGDKTFETEKIRYSFTEGFKWGYDDEEARFDVDDAGVRCVSDRCCTDV